MTTITLDESQSAAMRAVEDWWRDGCPGGTFTIGGYAGVGKSVLVRHIMDWLRSMGISPAACAYTGKAALVLRRKGIPASTIHRLIYDVDMSSGQPRFLRKQHLDCDFIVIDEASMVSRDLYDDLRSFGVPILAVGDHGQLEPVGDDADLMRDPMVRLETIHRQAATNAIIPFSAALRTGTPSTAAPLGDGVELLDSTADLVEAAMQADQAICAYNKRRMALNAAIRERRGHYGILGVGEKVVCLRNDMEVGIFNGETATVEDCADHPFLLDHVWVTLRSESGERIRAVADRQVIAEGAIPRGWRPFVTRYDSDERIRVIAITYGWALTCHKAQGSQWEHVLVVEERPNEKLWSHARWCYTAATRASERLTWVASNRLMGLF